MDIRVDTEILQILGISADDFVYLYLLHAKSHDLLATLELKPNTTELQTKGLIKLGEKAEDHTVRQKFLEMFQSSFDQMWSDLLSHFPLKVYSKGSVRVLRAKDANAKANLKAKTKYRSVVGNNKATHDRIVRLLKVELDIRRKSDSLAYMQQLQTWVNGYTWEKYEDMTEDDPEQQDGRITRRL